MANYWQKGDAYGPGAHRIIRIWQNGTGTYSLGGISGSNLVYVFPTKTKALDRAQDAAYTFRQRGESVSISWDGPLEPVPFIKQLQRRAAQQFSRLPAGRNHKHGPRSDGRKCPKCGV